MTELFEQRFQVAPSALWAPKSSICSVVIDMAQCNCFKSNKRAPERPIQYGNRRTRMANPEDWRKTVRLNKLLGMWAAKKLGITGPEAEAYSDALAVDALDPGRSD